MNLRERGSHRKRLRLKRVRQIRVTNLGDRAANVILQDFVQLLAKYSVAEKKGAHVRLVFKFHNQKKSCRHFGKAIDADQRADFAD
jgi:hypothetical protein